MKTIPRQTIQLLAMAGLSLLPSLASAVGPTAITAYSEGDLLIGFQQIGTGASTNDLEVDLGPASQFLNATSPFNLTFGVIPGTSTAVTNLNADLTAVFGAGWASNSASALVQWGVFGATNNDGTFGLPAETLFLTTAESTPGTYATPLNRFRATPDGVDAGNISSVTIGQFGFNGSISTTNSSQAVSQPTAQSNSYVTGTPGSNAFGTGYNIEQPVSGSATGPTNSVLDLYELQPDTKNGDHGVLLGTFTLDSAGDATFNPVAVPEPAPALVITFAATVFLGLARRRRSFTSLS